MDSFFPVDIHYAMPTWFPVTRCDEGREGSATEAVGGGGGGTVSPAVPTASYFNEMRKKTTFVMSAAADAPGMVAVKN